MTPEKIKLAGIVVVITILAALCGDLASQAVALSVAVPPTAVVRKPVAGAAMPPSVEKVVADTRGLFAPPPDTVVVPSTTAATGAPDASAGPWDEWLADPQHNLTLVGTMIGPGQEIAVVTGGGDQYALQLWQQLGSWRVYSITDTRVEFQRGATTTVLDLPMLAPASTPSPMVGLRGFKPSLGFGKGPRMHISRGSNGTTILQRSEVDAAFARPDGIVNGMRMDPIEKDGQPYGIKFNYLEPNNMFSYLGLRQGDVVLSINGQDIRNQDDGIKAYLTLKNEDSIDLQIERNGQPQDLHVEIQRGQPPGGGASPCWRC